MTVDTRSLVLLVMTLIGLGGSNPLCAAEAASDSSPPDAEQVFFEPHVRPILKTHCFLCHGELGEPEGGLDVRLAWLIQQGGDSAAAIAPGDADGSLLWQRIDSDEMPEGSKKLSASEKQIIRRWIAQGARTVRPEPQDPEAAKYTEEELSHWAFQPPRAVHPPELASLALGPADSGETTSLGAARSEDVPAPAAALTAIDAFILRRLADAGLSASPPADRATLIRRATFDVTGLPPTPAEVDAFVQDASPDAWAKVVDRLLNSPHYGERWGRHWLDAAGYAESDGSLGKDRERPYAWHYRNYVVEALNQDLPYDQFLIEQLAGDELIDGRPDGNNPQHVRWMAATGLLRMAPDTTETSDSLADRNQAVSETIKVVSSAVLGLTVGCAQCHDHRYDPISTEDYYRFRAIFDPIFPLKAWKKPSQRLVDLTDDQTRARIDEIEAAAVAMQEDISARRREHCQGIQDRAIAAAPEDVREALRAAVDTPAANQSDAQKALLDKYPTVRTIDWIVGQLIEYDRKAFDGFQAEEAKVAELRKTKPLPRMVMAAQENTEQIPESVVFFRGDPESPKDPVLPAELTVLAVGRPTATVPVHGEQGRSTSRRLAYARQLTDGTHPTVARVAVNRIWSHYFGRGLVASTGDFGLLSEPPSHPDLMDYLAADFVASGWRMKRLHKQILMSRTYRQSSRRGAADEIDPDNILISRMPMRRLDAESIRDAMLRVSDSLNVEMGGPSIPVAEDGEGKAVIGTRILTNGLFSKVESPGDQANRRSIYISARRDLPLNLLSTFDMPAMNPNCLRRSVSTVAPQSLWFLNDEQMIAICQSMAESLIRQSPAAPDQQVRAAFRRAFADAPTAAEETRCLEFVAAQAELFRGNPDPAWQETLKADPGAAHVRGLASLCQMFFSSNRFLYLP